MEFLRKFVSRIQTDLESLVGYPFGIQASSHLCILPDHDPDTGRNPWRGSVGFVECETGMEGGALRLIGPKIYFYPEVEPLFCQGSLRMLSGIIEETSHLLYGFDYVRRYGKIPSEECVEMIGGIDSWLVGRKYLEEASGEGVIKAYFTHCFYGASATTGQRSAHVIGHSLGRMEAESILGLDQDTSRTCLDRYREVYTMRNEEQLSLLPNMFPLMRIENRPGISFY